MRQKHKGERVRGEKEEGGHAELGEKVRGEGSVSVKYAGGPHHTTLVYAVRPCRTGSWPTLLRDEQYPVFRDCSASSQQHAWWVEGGGVGRRGEERKTERGGRGGGRRKRKKGEGGKMITLPPPQFINRLLHNLHMQCIIPHLLTPHPHHSLTHCPLTHHPFPPHQPTPSMSPPTPPSHIS